MPETATTGAPRRARRLEPRLDPGDGQDRPDRDERVRRRDDDRLRGLERRLDLGRRAGVLDARRSGGRAPRAPGGGGRSSPGTRASRRRSGPRSGRARRSSAGSRARTPSARWRSRATSVGRSPRAQPGRADDVRREVAIAEPEPGLLAVALEHLASPRTSRRRCPSPTRGCRCPASVYITVSWSGEMRRPWRSRSSAVLTMTSRRARDAPAARARACAPPTPPASRTTRPRLMALERGHRAEERSLSLANLGRRSIVSRSNGAGMRTMTVEKPSSR